MSWTVAGHLKIMIAACGEVRTVGIGPLAGRAAGGIAVNIGLPNSIETSVAIVLLLVFQQPTKLSAQNPPAAAMDTSPATALKTPWGEPDLQGIWTVESDTPLQRPAKYANQEFFTDAQRAELDKQRSALLGRDKRVERGTELDVAGAYNAVFMSKKHTGARTSLDRRPPERSYSTFDASGCRGLPPPIGTFVSRCCRRPKPARANRWHAVEASMMRRPRRGAQNFRLATTPSA